MRIYLIGFMGSGKTVLGRALAERLNFDFVDTDELIELYERMSVLDVFENKGEPHFRLVESKLLKGELVKKDELVVATGGGMPCFSDNIDFMLNNGLVVFLDIDEKILHERLMNDDSRPLIRDNADDLKVFIRAKMNLRRSFYSKAHIRINSSNLEDVFTEVQNYLR